jgi:hypothetical protein
MLFAAFFTVVVTQTPSSQQPAISLGFATAVMLVTVQQAAVTQHGKPASQHAAPGKQQSDLFTFATLAVVQQAALVRQQSSSFAQQLGTSVETSPVDCEQQPPVFATGSEHLLPGQPLSVE